MIILALLLLPTPSLGKTFDATYYQNQLMVINGVEILQKEHIFLGKNYYDTKAFLWKV